MGLADVAGWIAPAATMVAATMTASNLGARVTGWGFVVFAMASVAWTVVALATDQTNLLWTNVFLLAVNLLGIWRWLGRQARYADGGEAAASASAARPAPTLIPVGGLAGRKLTGRDDQAVGTVVEAMMRCDDARLAYVVVSEGGVGGVGENLHALPASALIFRRETVATTLPAEALAKLPCLEADAWPASAEEIAWPAAAQRPEPPPWPSRARSTERAFATKSPSEGWLRRFIK